MPQTTERTIDHDGIDGQWRVTWRRPDGYHAEQLFHSRAQAQAWVDASETDEALGLAILAERAHS
jgi:hypothetical protein